jgi:subtilisin family serine protease
MRNNRKRVPANAWKVTLLFAVLSVSLIATFWLRASKTQQAVSSLEPRPVNVSTPSVTQQPLQNSAAVSNAVRSVATTPVGSGRGGVRNKKDDIADTPSDPALWKRGIDKRLRTLPNGDVERSWLVEARQGKYPIQRVVELQHKDKKTGVESLVRRTATVADHVMVKLADQADEAALARLASSVGGGIRRKMRAPGLYLVEIPAARVEDFDAAMAALNGSPDTVRYAEPDHIVHAVAIPNDSSFTNLWGMHNTGQTGGQTSRDVSGAGTVDADVDAPEAWELTTGSRDVLVGVIDSGIDRDHEDLAANMWTNPGESGLDVVGNDKRYNGLDDDRNGYIDDWRGWDFVNEDNDPDDDNSHGTHCAGTIGGVGNNSLGVAGVCWNISLVAMKFLSAGGSGFTSDGIEAVYYASSIGVDLTSNSWGGGGFEQGLLDAIADAETRGILFVAAAGNDNVNNDSDPHYPSNYELDNIISVAATDRKDGIASFSCYGLTSVDVGAPGVAIWSTTPDDTYAWFNGTSMATPLVSGMCALLKSYRPSLTSTEIKTAIMQSVDRVPALEGKCVTGGRVNIHKALTLVEYLSLTETRFVDATGAGVSGNGDGFLNPGECIGCYVSIKNFGSSTATGVVLQASLPTNTYVTLVTTNAIAVGNLAAGESFATAPFLFNLATNMPTPYTVSATITASDGSGFVCSQAVVLAIYSSSTVRGRVTLDGVPLAGVQIGYTATPFSGTLTTDTTGAYAVILGEGSCELRINHNDFAPVTTNFFLPPSRTNLNFNFVTATISGRVTDESSGEGIPNAYIEYWSDSFWWFTETDSNGFYSFSNVFFNEETMELTVTVDGYQEEIASVPVPPSAADVDFALGSPAISVSPSAITETVVRGAKVQRKVTIKSLGSRPLEWTAQTGYAFTEVPMEWIEICRTGVSVPLPRKADFTFKGPYAVDFAFPFYGRLHNQLYVSQYGAVSFDADAFETDWPSPLPDRRTDQKYKKSLLALWWGEYLRDGEAPTYNDQGPGAIYVEQVDPETYVIQLQDRVSYGGTMIESGPWQPKAITAQAVIKSDGTIRYQYKHTEWGLQGYAIGIQNQAGSDGVTLHYQASVNDIFNQPKWADIFNIPWDLAGTAWESLAQLPPWLSVSTTNGTINGIGTNTLDVILDSGPAPVGTNTYTLGILSNDLNKPRADVVITFVVEPPPVPGFIEAENYNSGVNGTTLNDTTKGNAGGVYRNDDADISGTPGNYYISDITAGEWLEYTVNVTTAGLYEIGLLIAAENPGGCVHIERVGADVTGPVAIPSTGSSTNYTTVYTLGLPLAVGWQTLRVHVENGGFNMDQLTFSPARANTPPTVEAGTNQTVTLAFGRPPAVNGANVLLDAAQDDGTNAVWEDVLATWNVTIDSGVTYVANAGSALPGITAAYDFPGGTSGSGGGDGLSLESMGVDKQPISLELWFKPDLSTNYPTNGQILWETGGNPGFGIFYKNGAVEVAHDKNAGQISANVSALTNEFIQMVVTYDTRTSSGNFKLYINGALKATGSRSDLDLSNLDHAGLGKRGGADAGGAGIGDASTASFDGKIAIFRSYHNRILTAAQVQENYNSVTGKFMATANLTGVANDPDHDPLFTSWVLFAGPTNVQFSAALSLQTTVNFSMAGSYILQLLVNDARAQVVDEVVINVDADLASNMPPVALDASVVTDENTAVPIVLRSTDGDGDVIQSYTVQTGPSHGSINGTGPNRTYQPSAGYYGADSFTFTVNDGQTSSIPATISITIREINTTPFANAGTNQTITLSTSTPRLWTPSQIPLAAWYDAADATTLIEFESNVVQWNDKSGNMHHLTNVKGTPISGADINGLNAINFTSNMMESAGNPFGDTVSDAFVLAVHRVDTISHGTLFSLTGGGNAGASQIWQANVPQDDGQVRFETGGYGPGYDLTVNFSVIPGDVVLSGFYGSCSERRHEFYKNGALLDADTSMYAANVVGGMRVGGGSLYNVKYSDVDDVFYQDTTLGEFIVVKGTVSTENRLRLEGYLAHKWGLTTNLPPNHPYKSDPPIVGGPSAVVNLKGIAGDADNDPLTTTWSTVGGPATVTFDAPSATNTTATFTQVGTYTLRLTADDSKATASSNVVIEVVDSPKSSIIATAGANGAITPEGLIAVYKGDNYTFSITPYIGYTISNVVVDSVPIGPTNSYTFSNISADHTISASFSIRQYSLAYRAGNNGSVIGSTNQIVSYGADGSTVTAAPYPGCYFFAWSDGVTNNSRSELKVTKDINVTALFFSNAPPVIATGTAPVPVAGTSAMLQNVLTSGGEAEAWICWGQMDAGTHSTGNWQHVVSAGHVTQGVAFSNLVTGLYANRTYYYRCFATNAYGSDWSDTAEVFCGMPVGGNEGGGPVPGADTYLDAGLDNGLNSTWEDSLGSWNLTINSGVTYVSNTGSSLPGITAAYNFSGGTSGSNGCDGASLGVRGLNRDPITLELWFKPATSSTFPANGQVLWETGGTNGLGIFYNNGIVEVAHNDQRSKIAADVSALKNEYIQVVVTYDPTSTWHNFKLYINGDLKAVASSSDNDLCDGDGAGLGNRGGNDTGGAGSGDALTRSFAGRIAIFRAYYNQILDANGVSRNYASIASRLTTIVNLAATDVSDATATFNARIASVRTNYNLYVYYGPIDGGTNTALWGSSAYLGSWTNVVTNISYTVSGLTAGRAQNYTFCVSNAAGRVWASPSWHFVMPGAMTPSAVTTNHSVPHAWLAARNSAWTNNYEASVLADPDGDGFATWQEYWSGTDPLDPESCFKIESVTYNGAQITIKWKHARVDPAIPPIAIQGRSNLTSGVWSNLGTHVPENGTNTWSGSGSGRQFYRLKTTVVP